MKHKNVVLCLFLVLTASIGFAQWRGQRFNNGPIVCTAGGEWVDKRTVKTAHEITLHSTGTPEWANDPSFSHDVFTFVRIIGGRDPFDSTSAGNWITDFPDSDVSFSHRIQQVASVKVNPDGRTIQLTDPALCDYPWSYTVEPGALRLREVLILQQYLLNGGFFMADSFWGDWQGEGFYKPIKRVFPEREFVELPMDHPVFHCVFDLKMPKNQLQTPNRRQGFRSEYNSVTWETHQRQDGSWEECKDMRVRAMFEDKNRIMIIATHNCDMGKSWEREGVSDYFFHQFSEKRGYPFGINIVFKR
jgi:hypothetical protein